MERRICFHSVRGALSHVWRCGGALADGAPSLCAPPHIEPPLPGQVFKHIIETHVDPAAPWPTVWSEIGPILLNTLR